MKTKEELNTLKNEVESVSRKFSELTEEELEQVIGGITQPDIKDYRQKLLKNAKLDKNKDIRDPEEMIQQTNSKLTDYQKQLKTYGVQ